MKSQKEVIIEEQKELRKSNNFKFIVNISPTSIVPSRKLGDYDFGIWDSRLSMEHNPFVKTFHKIKDDIGENPRENNKYLMNYNSNILKTNQEESSERIKIKKSFTPIKSKIDYEPIPIFPNSNDISKISNLSEVSQEIDLNNKNLSSDK